MDKVLAQGLLSDMGGPCFMRRAVAVGTLYIVLFGGLQSSSEAEQPKQRSFASHLFGPRGFLMAGASTAIQHVRDVPKEWGPGVPGLGKRFASAFGHHLVKSTVSYGVAKVTHEDLRYYRSEKTG